MGAQLRIDQAAQLDVWHLLDITQNKGIKKQRSNAVFGEQYFGSIVF